MKHKALTVVFLAVSATMQAQWEFIEIEDMMYGKIHTMALFAEASEGTVVNPVLLVLKDPPQGFPFGNDDYAIGVAWDGYPVYNSMLIVRIRYREEQQRDMGALAGSGNEVYMTKPEEAIERFSALSEGGKVVIGIPHSGGGFTARWDITGFNEAFAELRARAGAE